MEFKLPQQLSAAINYGFEKYNPTNLTKKQIRKDIEKLIEYRKNNGDSTGFIIFN